MLLFDAELLLAVQGWLHVSCCRVGRMPSHPASVVLLCMVLRAPICSHSPASAPCPPARRPLIYSCIGLATNRDVEDNRK